MTLPNETLTDRLMGAVSTGKFDFVKRLLAVLKTNNIPLPENFFDTNRSYSTSAVALVLNSIREPDIFNNFYLKLLLLIKSSPDSNPIHTLATLSNNDGIPYSMDPRTMVPLLILLSKEGLVENQHVEDFVKSLSDESFKQVTTALIFNQREDIAHILEDLRKDTDLLLDEPTQTLRFSSLSQNDEEPATKKRRGLQQ